MSIDNKTRPTGEQLRFVSSKTGEHILDDYLEAAEYGNRTLADLLSDVFDTNGTFAADNFQFRIDSSTRKYQVRVGLFANANAGWTDIPNGFVFRQRGTFANSTAYEQLDVVTLNNTTYVCTSAHTSSTATPDLTKFSIIVDGTALNTATTSAQSSATSAAASATSAANSASTATTKASEASSSAANAASSATTATTQAGISTTKATEAASSASSALTSATNAATSQSAAAASQSAAASSASAASASQTAAANSATSASSSASSASNSATSASASASTATTKASESSASAALANDWATKTSSTVAGGEWSAKYHAQQAASSSTAAATSATNAANSATAANSAKTAAESARDATLAAFDSFDDRYLGTKTSDPTVDNDGNALVAGSLYFNSAAGVMKVYTGTSWVAAYVSGTDFLSLSGGTLTGPLTLSGNATANLHAVPKQQLDSGLATKANTTHTHIASDITDSTSAGRTILTAADASAQRSALGLGTSATQNSTAFAASAHTHVINDVTGLQSALDGKAASSHTHTSTEISDSTAAGRNFLTAANVAAQRTLLSLGSAALSNSADFAAATHTHAITDVTNLQTSLDAKLNISATTYVQQTSATGAAQLPAGNDAARPASPVAGMLRYNSTSQSVEIYTTSWGSVGGGMSTGKAYFFTSF